MSERPAEFMISLFMAVLSSTQVFDIILMVYLARTKSNRIHVLIAYLTPVIITSQILKPYFQDPRPALSCIHGYGMPSGHSTAAGAVFVTAITLYLQKVISSFDLALLYGIMMPVQAYSRIYLHYHSEAQVLSGFSLGATVAMGLYLIFPLLPDQQELSQRVYLNEMQEHSSPMNVPNGRCESLMV
mmetsp:Transcript_34772/g.34432  ORF Transcript_34772/g.34432 Transcript_34772/m.34432 type:complete len:186 (-) Transcript_34772:44-601(-)|eukprot:CAMPEP_0197007840 /NCGR_PEP_ID=MMETSP1380-20130617/42501_1 /TAXON_ID=5936 /ORGANISM="Euplotes crassus, Strain CT5" /LENGTH=185 /DNA_ID=CAMNT_0042428123 /DNA_START=105 /DNA_END=662 /DNA_ORIENTATION=+